MTHVCPIDLDKHVVTSNPEALNYAVMEPEKSTNSKIIENLEICLRNPSMKASRIHRRDFRAFLFLVAFIVLIIVIGAVIAVKYIALNLGNLGYVVEGGVLASLGKKLFGKIGAGK